MLAVAEGVGYEETVLCALLHELQTLGPSGYHAVEGELCGLAALYGAVEECAVDEHALVVALHGVGSLRLLAVALVEHLVLQSAGQSHHAVFLCVVCEIFLTSLFVALEALCCRSTLLLFLLLEKVLYDGLRFSVAHFRLVAGNDVFDCLCEIVDVEVFGAHLCELASDAQT